MKKIILSTIIALIANACYSQDKIISYILDIEAENSIYQFIKNDSNDEKAFYFENIGQKRIKIHLRKPFIDSSYSNRKLFINDKLYPIIFDTDEYFYVKSENSFPIINKYDKNGNPEFIKMPSISERMKNRDLYGKSQKHSIIDWSTYWIVDEKGKLIETNLK